MKENKNIEFKSDITNSFLKTVSAFSNYDDKIIVFGKSIVKNLLKSMTIKKTL